MSEVLLRLQPTPRLLKAGTPRDPSRGFPGLPIKNFVVSEHRAVSLARTSQVFPEQFHVVGRQSFSKLGAWTQEGWLQELNDSPVSVELHPICSETHFDRVLAEAQKLEESVIVLWYGYLVSCLRFRRLWFLPGSFPVLACLISEKDVGKKGDCVNVNLVAFCCS